MKSITKCDLLNYHFQESTHALDHHKHPNNPNITGPTIVSSVFVFTILSGQQIQVSLSTVGWKKALAAGFGQLAPAYDHLRKILPKGREDGTREYPEKGIPHNRDLTINDDAHRPLGMAGCMEDA